jgi:two-component system, chemotaxis family, CheB/CheR fusion protein
MNPMDPSENDPSFTVLLEYLKQSRGFDFTGYKPGTMSRRIEKRMHDVEVKSFTDYVDYLEVHPEEFAFLFNTILINVTTFFRDPPAWEFLAKDILPRVIAARGATSPVRVMSAGSASGEEAFTVAMLLAEVLGEQTFQQRVKIYATDLDEEALVQARSASYSPQAVEDVPVALRQKYFQQVGGRYVFKSDLRRSIIFGRHDLLRDAPISRLDLLICRNTLMYFNAETQNRVLQRFHYALNDGGFLFLGKAEMLLSHGNLFAPVDLKCRVFSKVPGPAQRERTLPPGADSQDGPLTEPAQLLRLRDHAFEAATDAMLLVDAAGTLVLANDPARSLFGLRPRDIGRPFQDLEISYRPVELRSLLDQAYAEGRPQSVTRVERHLPGGESQFLDVLVTPLRDPGGPSLGASLSFQDRTAYYQTQQQLQRTKQDLETAYEELQSANEELETTNEELQSTIEELQTTNEELQSTNEEMETMNEELQSTNAELHTANETLSLRTSEARQASSFLQSILASVKVGVVVVDPDLKVLLWNEQAQELWGLRADEVVGHALPGLDIGLPVSEVGDVVRALFAGRSEATEQVLAATNRRGKSIQCRVTCTLRLDAEGARKGVVVLMESDNT